MQIVPEQDITAERLALMREMQYLMVLRVYLSEQLLGYRSLLIDVLAIGKFARFAHEKRCSLRDVLEQRHLLDAFITQVPSSQCRDVIRWLNFLRIRNPVHELGFEVAQAKKWAELKMRSNEYHKSRSQTAPLPTRIYLGVISSLSSELDNIEAHRDRLMAALREGIKLHREYKAKGWKMGASFGPELIEKHGLKDFLSRMGCSADLPGLASALTHIQRVCKLQIHTFSGMRDEEAEHLPYHCMVTKKAGHGKTHSLIAGVTTKLDGARAKITHWVTTESQGFRAIRVAQSFADVIYEFLGAKPGTAEKTKDDFPLFVSTGYLPWMNTQEASPDSSDDTDTSIQLNESVGLDTPMKASRYAASRTLGLTDLTESLKASLFPVIEASDIAELAAIDPFRDWASEPAFAVGKRWSLKTHQLRRSLALYANASGLVKSSSLRRQLQHITREMGEYYGRGSLFAKNFLKDDPKGYKEHICSEWQDTEQEAQYLAFARDVLDTDERLCGPGGSFYDLKKQRGEVMTAKEVKQQLKLGRMSYKAHPLGGCTHVGTCDKQKGLRLTSGICISEGCKSLVGKHSNIIKLIAIQRQFVSRRDPDSIEGAMEKEELDILEVAEVQWRPSKRPVSGSPRGKHV
jgi:hypothetical protein